MKTAAVVAGVYALLAAAWVLNAGVVRTDPAAIELLNAACDPTRELWREINADFVADYYRRTGVRVRVSQSHGGSASQARAVSAGLPADVVTLGMFPDTDAIRKAGRIDPGWETELPNRSLPFVSTIVMVVRKGNPKGIRDWPDLARPDVTAIVPNPKTSGNGKWAFLAVWGSVTGRGGSAAEAEAFTADVFRRVPVLDTSARGASHTFLRAGKGDVHLTWENEAYLEVAHSRGALEVVYPPRSILAEAPVAVVDAVVRDKGTAAAATAYLEYLYTEPAQEVIARHHFRPTHPAVRARTAARFPAVELYPVTDVVSSWAEAQEQFFADGAAFDRAFQVRD